MTTPGAEMSSQLTATDPEPKLADQWLSLALTGHRTAVKTVQRFVEAVEDAVPSHGDGLVRRRAIVDGALEMADRLVHIQNDLVRHAISSFVFVNVDVDVDVDLASRATRAIEGAEPASARG